jgi:hypothetical protein
MFSIFAMPAVKALPKPPSSAQAEFNGADQSSNSVKGDPVISPQDLGVPYSLKNPPPLALFERHPDCESLMWCKETCNATGQHDDLDKKSNKCHWTFCALCKESYGMKPRQVSALNTKKHEQSSEHHAKLEKKKMQSKAGTTALDAQLSKDLREKKAMVASAAFVGDNNETMSKLQLYAESVSKLYCPQGRPGSETRRWSVSQVMCPRQTNGDDCGPHTLWNAYCICTGRQLSPLPKNFRHDVLLSLLCGKLKDSF